MPVKTDAAMWAVGGFIHPPLRTTRKHGQDPSPVQAVTLTCIDQILLLSKVTAVTFAS
jgi:hypothetical protein